MTSVLFVCLGNICRSPAAEGILRHMAHKDKTLHHVKVASCGLGSWHVGQLPDIRMQEAAQRRGVILSSLAQQFQKDYFEKYDYILAVDREVLNVLYQYAKKPEHVSKLHLITSYSVSYQDQDIPDPFYDNDGAFEHVLDMLEDSCEGIIQQIKEG